jgi:hypothetical protein
MASIINGVADNQMVTEAAAAATTAFTLNSGQTRVSSNLIMTKSAATTRYNLQANFGSYTDNQLVPATLWASGLAPADTAAPSVPGIPSYAYNPTVTGDDDTLTWSSSTDNTGVTSYDIAVSKDGVAFYTHNTATNGNGSPGSSIGPTTSLSAYFNNYFARTYGTGVYRFKIRAKDAAGNLSAYSVESVYTMDSERLGGHATSVNATNISQTTFTLNWVKSTYECTYRIYKDNVLYTTTGNVSTVNLTNLTQGTTSSWKIGGEVISNPGTFTQYSTPINVTMLVQTGPATPTGLTANALSSSDISTSWNASSGATGYELYRSLTPGGTYTLITTTASTNYVDVGRNASTTYWYKILAYNGSGSSALSAAVSATTQSEGGGGIA